MAVDEAIKTLLELNVAVVTNRWHISKCKNGDYMLLNFNSKGNLKEDTDETFVDVNDAVSKFIQKTRLA